MSVDVVVVGAGLAGLAAARGLAEGGARVLLVDRRADVGARVATTGIFVRRTLEDFDLPEDCLGPPVRDVVLASPAGRALHLQRHRSYLFGYGHIPIFAAIAATGAGLHVAAYYIDHEAHISAAAAVATSSAAMARGWSKLTAWTSSTSPRNGASRPDASLVARMPATR